MADSSTHLSSRPATPIRCVICQEPLSADIARLVPCGHEFDSVCIDALVQGSGVIARRCPLCRTRVEEIHRNFGADGTHQSVPVGPARPESPLMNGTFIPTDEELTDDMSDLERARVMELRRIHQLPSRRQSMSLHTDHGYCREGKRFVQVRSGINVKMSQTGRTASTSFRIDRTLSITTVPATSRNERFLQQSGLIEDPNAIAIARQECRLLLAKLGIDNQEFRSCSVRRPYYDISYDAKGLKTRVKKYTHIYKRHPNEITITRTTELHEEFLPRPPPSQRERIRGIREVERERRTRLARTEIRAILAWVVKELRGTELEGLDRSMTGIFECVVDGECEYCGEGPGHKNGSCELVFVRSVRVGPWVIGG